MSDHFEDYITCTPLEAEAVRRRIPDVRLVSARRGDRGASYRLLHPDAPLIRKTLRAIRERRP